VSPLEQITAAIWAELRRLAHLISELAAAENDLTARVIRLELLHDITEDDHAHGDRGAAVRGGPPPPHER
jgi:hypothetical protein